MLGAGGLEMTESGEVQSPFRQLLARFGKPGRRIADAVLQPSFLCTIIILFLIALYLANHGSISWPQLASMAIGGLVGLVELLGRYRHAPMRAVLTGSGFGYILINILASWAAYYLLGEFKVFETTIVAKETTQVLSAGFGSLVFMRSSFFKVRVGDSDIGIGPAAILDTFLLVADRGVDRREAVARARDVSELVSQVSDPRIVARMLLKYSLALMQNVDEKTSSDLSEAINKIMNDAEVPDAIKMDIVALRLGIVVGPDVLEAAVEALGDRLKVKAQAGGGQPQSAGGDPPSAEPVASQAPNVPPEDAVKANIDKQNELREPKP